MTSKLRTEKRELLDCIAVRNKARRAQCKQAATPEVGIFFVVHGPVLIDSTPASEVRAYADMKTHEKGHDNVLEANAGCGCGASGLGVR